MRFKGTAVLFVLLAVLAGWVYWTDIRGREAREQAEQDAARVFAVDASSIVRISLIHPSRVEESVPDQDIVGARTDSGWEFVSPPGLEADTAEWDRLAGNVARVERGEVVASEDPDLMGFGLTNPTLRVEVEMSDGDRDQILFGDENPAGTDNYAKLASSDAVFLSPTTWLGLLSVETRSLRDKTILRFEPDAVERIEISAGGVVLQKEDDAWRLESPIRSAADAGVVGSFLRTLSSARAADFVDDPSVQTGLDTPTLDVTLTTASGDQHVLRVGGPAAQANHHHAQDTARDPVFVIADSVVEAASKSTFEWRDKSVALIDRPAISSIVLESLDSRIELRRTDDAWTLVGEGPVDSTRVSSILTDLELERATEIIDSPGSLAAYGLDPPRLRGVLGTESGTSFGFGFGAETGENAVYWKADDETAVKVVSASLFEAFSVDPSDLVVSDSAP